MIVDYLKVTGVIVALVGLLVGVRLLGKRYRWHPEWQRKTLHVALGLTALTFPWLFDASWPVLTICAVGGLILLALRHVPYLRRHLGGTLHDVNRTSAGELLFALAIALLFALTPTTPVLYVLPLAILTVADTAAALVGAHWGKHHFGIPDGRKSWEGVAAFAVVSLGLTVPLLRWLTVLPWSTLVLVALTVTLITTLVEAIAWHGLDNLLIPVSGYLALTLLLVGGNSFLLYQLLIFGGLAISAQALPTWFAHHTRLTALLTVYCLWIGGPLLWLVGLLALLVGHLVMRKQRAPAFIHPFDAMPAAHWFLIN